MSSAPPINPELARHVSAQLPSWGAALGFADVGVARLELDDDLRHLQQWLDRGHHGGMAFMARDPELRADPARLRGGTLSVIVCRMNYRWDAEADAPSPRQLLSDGRRGYIARYALGRDYHRVMRARMLRLGRRLEAEVGPHGYRVLCDSAPALEKAMARNANLGWIGKNTLLMREDVGSFFFIGEIYCDLPLPPRAAPPLVAACGSCQACLRVCPTQAFVGPWQLDARRCVSYLTIEHHGPIPLELRPLIGNRIFGCDDCQLVCPWNRFAEPSVEADFAPRNGLDAPQLVELFGWDETRYLAQTEGMALRRAGYARWLRNVAVAMGNAPADPQIVAALRGRLASADDAVLAEHYRWALDAQLERAQQPAAATAGSTPSS